LNISEMGWELRLFFPLPDSSRAGVLDLFRTPTTLVRGPPKLERRSDVYIDLEDHSVGLKYRSAAEGQQGQLEIKTRSEQKRRGAEKWKKVRPEDDSASALAKLLPQHAGRVEAAPRVRLHKQRFKGEVGGLSVEQTELEVEVQASGKHDEWHSLSQRFRTIAFEGSPAKCYEVLGCWMELGEEWAAEDLQAALKAQADITRSSLEESTGLKPNEIATPPAIVGGYPQFVGEVIQFLLAQA